MAAAVISQYKTSHYLFTTLLVLQGLCSVIFVSPATAEDAMFLPNTLPYSASEDNASTINEVRTLSNLNLAEQARLMRSGEMSAEQRAINYQWLSIHAGEESGVNTGKAFSRIVQQTLLEYWQSKHSQSRDNKFITDRDGDISTQLYDVDYKVRLSDNGIKFGFKYEFD